MNLKTVIFIFSTSFPNSILARLLRYFILYIVDFYYLLITNSQGDKKHMKESISVFLKRLSDILEFVISFILTAGIILLCLRVAGAIYKIPDLNVWPYF